MLEWHGNCCQTRRAPNLIPSQHYRSFCRCRGLVDFPTNEKHGVPQTFAIL